MWFRKIPAYVILEKKNNFSGQASDKCERWGYSLWDKLYTISENCRLQCWVRGRKATNMTKVNIDRYFSWGKRCKRSLNDFVKSFTTKSQNIPWYFPGNISAKQLNVCVEVRKVSWYIQYKYLSFCLSGYIMRKMLNKIG